MRQRRTISLDGYCRDVWGGSEHPKKPLQVATGCVSWGLPRSVVHNRDGPGVGRSELTALLRQA